MAVSVASEQGEAAAGAVHTLVPVVGDRLHQGIGDAHHLAATAWVHVARVECTTHA
jgi:hypothetical protein